MKTDKDDGLRGAAGRAIRPESRRLPRVILLPKHQSQWVDAAVPETVLVVDEITKADLSPENLQAHLTA